MKLQARWTSIHMWGRKLAHTMAQNVLSGCSTIAYVKSKILANMYTTREAPKHGNGQPGHPTNIGPSTEGLKGRPSRFDKREDEVNVIAMDPMRQSNCPMSHVGWGTFLCSENNCNAWQNNP